jgi:excisionase family DNA binding protein
MAQRDGYSDWLGAYVSVGEFASRLGVSERTVRRAAARGRVRSVQLGGPGSPYKIPHTELRRLLLERDPQRAFMLEGKS